jgi:hypothetical protein
MHRRLFLAVVGSVALSFDAGTALAVDELLPCVVGIVRPLGFAKFVCRTSPSTPFALPGPGDDPTVTGGTLRILDTGGAGGDHTYALAAADWRPLSTPGEFAYSRFALADPVKQVVVRGRIVRAIVQRQGPDWTPPFSGDMAVVLTVGTMRYCASFGGTTIANSVVRLKRRSAAAPPFCVP